MTKHFRITYIKTRNVTLEIFIDVDSEGYIPLNIWQGGYGPYYYTPQCCECELNKMELLHNLNTHRIHNQTNNSSFYYQSTCVFVSMILLSIYIRNKSLQIITSLRNHIGMVWLTQSAREDWEVNQGDWYSNHAWTWWIRSRTTNLIEPNTMPIIIIHYLYNK